MSANSQPVSLSNLDNSLSGVDDGYKKPSYGGSKKVSVFKPSSERKCTDVMLLAMFGVFWIGMAVVGIYAYSNSNLDSLLYKRDYKGALCSGIDNGKVVGYNGKLLYPVQITIATSASSSDNKKDAPLPYICVEKCPTAGQTVKDFYGKYTEKVLFNTAEAYGVCLPSKESMKTLTSMAGAADDLLDYQSVLKRIGDDIYEGGAAIFIIGGIVTALISLAWLFVLSKATAIIVWGSIFAFFASFVGGAFVFGCNGFELECSTLKVPTLPKSENSVSELFVSDQNLTTGYKVAFVIFCLIAAAILCMVVCLRKQIKLAIGIMQEVSKALMQMFSLMFFPLIPFAIMCVFMVWWCSVTVALASMEPDPANVTVTDANGGTDQITVYGQTTSTSNLFWFHFFGLLWTVQVIEGIAIMTVAGAFCAWYWRDDKTNLGHKPVLDSFFRTMRFHFGTICFGALLIAIIQFLRAVMNYLKDKMKEAKDNMLVKLAFCVLNCFFACLESCMKYIGKNAYILTAMKGTDFCTSCFKGLRLLFANGGRFVALNTAAAFVVCVSKLAIMTATSLIAYSWLNSNEDIGNPLAPTMVSLTFAWVTTSIIMSLYDMGTDTILMCVIEDEAANKATGQYYASPSITKLLPAAKK